ncbi:MAG: metal-dependent hydrolase [Saprospiraceae bacterium]|nr:metal-dependent hydrolase [Saprospiraceae bacterium]MCB0626398.1 metal-dependent hydrolase [Saprospiraceae bacterium]MCB0677618.1 metal-dependent hydrolase [Saprospiraceae bacterium]MCB0683518.1 metal-dependent hydrolase [Saprospiraceae bacterium]
MASAFGHALVAGTIGSSYGSTYRSWKFWLLGVFCAVVPDADVLAFRFGIPYEHVLGHRGITHSLFFSALLGMFVTALFFREIRLWSRKGLLLLLFFFLCTASHALLDALTNGGRGVALLAPFDNTRYFFPWRPIQVSPLSIDRFFSHWGWRVIRSELVWIGIPCLLYTAAMRLRRGL